ncbi:MAG: hypothetical protein PHC38_10360 [Weeksellaceae bacterium]|nr:hypothetical protein [Weeksellaceae bacterium]
MSNQFLLSEAQGRASLKYLEELENQFKSFPLNFDGNLLLREEDVCKKLMVSARSMRRYRKQNYFRYIRIGGQVFYYKMTFAIDLMRLNLLHEEQKQMF